MVETSNLYQNNNVPIRDYAAIGDCHGDALVSRDGSIDWCSLGRFDANPIFCRIVDNEKGGFFSITPDSKYSTTRNYIGDTNILQTDFTSKSGRFTVTDFMPTGRSPGSGVHEYVKLSAPLWIVRIIECKEGNPSLNLIYKPSEKFAAEKTELSFSNGFIFSKSGTSLYSDIKFRIQGESAVAEVQLAPGETRTIIVSAQPTEIKNITETAQLIFEITKSFWDEWSSYCRYNGPFRKAVMRSALVLKMLTYAPSGAIVAAPTTSLPEMLGGTRNWDYRYSWLRDSTFTLYALSILGYSGEAMRFSNYVQKMCIKCEDYLQIMYGANGELILNEKILEHLSGHKGSRPVRTGNNAYLQQQLDVYGEVLDWAYLLNELGKRFSTKEKDLLSTLAKFTALHWMEPDHGIWEMRGEPRHHVYGKIMSWVALDRAIKILGENSVLKKAMKEISHQINEKGIDPETGTFTQAFGSKNIDASLLLIPAVNYPVDSQTMEKTIRAIEKDLRRGNYLMRYNVNTSEDGIDGGESGEGAFLICSFWLVDALLFTNRQPEAANLFEKLLAQSNDVGLYSEEIDPDTNEFLGNFPQAFTHLAMIQNAINFELFEHGGVAALQGTHADRAHRSVGATVGIKAIWEAFKKTHNVGRILSSKKSIMPDKWKGTTPQEIL